MTLFCLFRLHNWRFHVDREMGAEVMECWDCGRMRVRFMWMEREKVR